MRINTYLEGRRNTESWRMLKNMRTERKKEIITLITLEKWEQYFQQLLTEKKRGCEDNNQLHNIRIIGLSIRLTLKEVEKQCNTLKNGKAPEPGDIYGELIKYGSRKLYKHLQKLFQCINRMYQPNGKSHIYQLYSKRATGVDVRTIGK